VFPGLGSLLLHPALEGIKLSDEDSIQYGPEMGSGHFAEEERRKARITRRGCSEELK